jgi:hypothetical protein
MSSPPTRRSASASCSTSASTSAGLVHLPELPETDNITFTKRCRKWKADAGYRGEFSRWVCARLNVYQDRHC